MTLMLVKRATRILSLFSFKFKTGEEGGKFTLQFCTSGFFAFGKSQTGNTHRIIGGANFFYHACVVGMPDEARVSGR